MAASETTEETLDGRHSRRYIHSSNTVCGPFGGLGEKGIVAVAFFPVMLDAPLI
jgi:hypothetical protein